MQFGLPCHSGKGHRLCQRATLPLGRPGAKAPGLRPARRWRALRPRRVGRWPSLCLGGPVLWKRGLWPGGETRCVSGSARIGGLFHWIRGIFLSGRQSAGGVLARTRCATWSGGARHAANQAFGGTKLRRFGVAEEAVETNLGSNAIRDQMGDPVKPLLPLPAPGQGIAQAAQKLAAFGFQAFGHVTFCRMGARDLGNDGTLDHILQKGNAGSPAPASCRRYAECRHAPPLRSEDCVGRVRYTEFPTFPKHTAAHPAYRCRGFSREIATWLKVGPAIKTSHQGPFQQKHKHSRLSGLVQPVFSTRPMFSILQFRIFARLNTFGKISTSSEVTGLNPMLE